MKALPTLLSAIAFGMLMVACRQVAPNFPPPPAAGAHWSPEPGQRPEVDPRFQKYAEQPALREALARLERYMGGKRRSDSFSAEELAAASLITKADNSRKGSGGFILILGPRDFHVLEAEKTYLGLDEAERRHLAKEVMADFLAKPARLSRSKLLASLRESARIHEALMEQAGGFFAKPERAEELFLNECSSWYARSTLFLRMAVRCLLEDVACNPALDHGTRCGALACLRDVYLRGTRYRSYNSIDGTWPGSDMIDALPFEEPGLERALFGKPVIWKE